MPANVNVPDSSVRPAGISVSTITEYAVSPISRPKRAWLLCRRRNWSNTTGL